MIVYELESENLTELGGPMGTERTLTNGRKLFQSAQSAKKYAEGDYKTVLQWYDQAIAYTRSRDKSLLSTEQLRLEKRCLADTLNTEEQIEWKREGRGWSSQDLSFVMYHVRRVQIRK